MSLISANEEIVQDILQVLLEDLFLRWEEPVGQKGRHDKSAKIRDVRSFSRPLGWTCM
jgi:hypothetical protein